jgi:hypothetical protein
MKLIQLFLIPMVFLLTSCKEENVIWKGTWESIQYPSVMGAINVQLPSSLKPQQAFQTPVIVSYSTNSLYRPNESINVDFEVQIKQGGSSEGSGNNEDVVVSFKGIPLGDQTITYTAVVKEKADTISGQYTSVMPGDKGIFTIQK